MSNPDTTRLARLKAKRDELVDKRRKLIYGCRVLDANRLNGRIEALESEIKEAEQYEPRRLSEMMDKETLDQSGIAKMIVKMHLAADYLNECTMDLRVALKKHGFEDCSLFHLVRDIERQSAKMANLVCNADFAGLSGFMSNNAEFIDNAHAITEKYIDNHLKIN